MKAASSPNSCVDPGHPCYGPNITGIPSKPLVTEGQGSAPA